MYLIEYEEDWAAAKAYIQEKKLLTFSVQQKMAA
jgi:hypothetical protein